MLAGGINYGKGHMNRVDKSKGSRRNCLWGYIIRSYSGTIPLGRITGLPSGGRVHANAISPTPRGVTSYYPLPLLTQ